MQPDMAAGPAQLVETGLPWRSRMIARRLSAASIEPSTGQQHHVREADRDVEGCPSRRSSVNSATPAIVPSTPPTSSMSASGKSIAFRRQ